MKVKVSQATRLCTKYMKNKLVPMLVGSPGVGKSQIAYQIASDFGLTVIDLRLSQCDPTDLLGYPTIQGNKAGYVPMNTFPIEGDDIPANSNGWLLFLDEMNAASNAVQSAAYKLVLDRMVGIYKLHPNVAIMCAGNLETDNAIVNPLSTALQSRLVHMELEVCHEEWVDWAASKEFDHRITDFIKFKPGNLFTFKPDHSDNTYGCPRTWEFANRIIKSTEDSDIDRLPMLAGAISEGLARELLVYFKVYNDLPKPAQMLSTPELVNIPSEPSVLYALTGCISHNANEATISQLMKLINRLPKEFQIVTMRDIVRRKKELIKQPTVMQWITQSAVELF